MKPSQLYIGTLNGVVACFDQYSSSNVSGYFYHSYCPSGTRFETLEQLLFCMEELYNKLQFPYPATNERLFQSQDRADAADGPEARDKRPKKRIKIMKDEELLLKHGDMGSFIIRVQHRQNSSWQGRLTWVEKDQTVNFRSVWELIKLIDSALNTTSRPEGPDPDPAWQISEDAAEKEA